jgi:hypothetical protein
MRYEEVFMQLTYGIKFALDTNNELDADWHAESMQTRKAPFDVE